MDLFNTHTGRPTKKVRSLWIGKQIRSQWVVSRQPVRKGKTSY